MNLINTQKSSYGPAADPTYIPVFYSTISVCSELHSVFQVYCKIGWQRSTINHNEPFGFSERYPPKKKGTWNNRAAHDDRLTPKWIWSVSFAIIPFSILSHHCRLLPPQFTLYILFRRREKGRQITDMLYYKEDAPRRWKEFFKSVVSGRWKPLKRWVHWNNSRAGRCSYGTQRIHPGRAESRLAVPNRSAEV